MEIVIEKMAAGGKGMARHNGKVVFVPGALPGERVTVEPKSMKRDFIEASLTGIIESSPSRVAPFCPLANICGGCDFSEANYEQQVILKKAILEDVLRRADLHPGDMFPITTYPSPSSLEYRSRFRFRIMKPGIPAFTARNTNDPIPIDDCPCAVPTLRQSLKDGSLRRRICDALAAEATKKRRPIADDLSVHVFSDEHNVITSLDTDTATSVWVCGKEIAFDVRGFFQSNIAALEQLIPQVTKGLSGERALDLYSGVGTFSIFLQDIFPHVVLMEHNAEALSKAPINMQNNNSEHEPPLCCAVSDKDWPSHNAAALRYDAIIADPPRQGLTPTIVKYLGEHPVPVFRYVSCDPVTMARDVRQLCTYGYVIEEIQLHDFYPQTSHMETLTLLTHPTVLT